MEQLVKNQPDWDDTFNKNFSKFGNSSFTDNVIYLNGAQKDTNGGQLWWVCRSLGETNLYHIEGYLQLPAVAAGQTIDVFNVPGITSTVRSAMIALKDGFVDNNVHLDTSSNPGTFCIKNFSSQDQKSWKAKYCVWAVCDNN